MALAAGAIAGLILALRSRRAATPAIPVATRDLAADQEALLARLKEIGGAVDDGSARERYRLELAAARVLLDLGAAPAEPSAAAAVSAPAPARPLVPFLWGVAATSAIFGLVLWVMAQAQDRPEGGSITGNSQLDTAAAPAPGPDPALEEIRSFADAHPGSVDAQLDLAQALIQRDQLVPAFEAAQRVLQKDPENPRGLAYSGVVRSAMGQGEVAMSLLDRAIQRDPTLAEAWVYRGLVATDLGQFAVAVESWETALKLRPDGAEVIREPLERVRALAKEQATGKAPVAGLPADHPAIAAAPAPAPAPAPGGGVKGTIELDPALVGKVPAGATLFLSVRPDGQTGGPPSAAKRLPASFPTSFTIGPADSMMGLPWPEHATLEARVDADGNAMTRDPSDPVARATGVVAGAELRLVLRVP